MASIQNSTFFFRRDKVYKKKVQKLIVFVFQFPCCIRQILMHRDKYKYV